jgi:hypothetical protein
LKYLVTQKAALEWNTTVILTMIYFRQLRGDQRSSKEIAFTASVAEHLRMQKTFNFQFSESTWLKTAQSSKSSLLRRTLHFMKIHIWLLPMMLTPVLPTDRLSEIKSYNLFIVFF